MTAKPWWFEIPSVEHPRLLLAALEEADARSVTTGRVAMGSGLQLLTPRELDDMLSIAHEHEVDVYAYVSARNSWEPLVDGGAGEQVSGEMAFEHALEEIRWAADAGVHGVLIGDVGLLAAAGELRRSGELGALGLKSAAAIAPHNAAAAALFEQLGATSINVPSSATQADLVAMRRRLRATTSIDLYVESPADLGGGLRYREIPQLVELLPPLSLKIGIRNAPPLYPYGVHLEPAAERSIREKIRRAEIVLRLLDRAAEEAHAVAAELTGTGGNGGES